jgi:hypothetical protein
MTNLNLISVYKGKTKKGRSSMMVLEPTESGTYEVVERQLLLDTNDEDQTIMDDAGHFVKYALAAFIPS